ncbi:MAG: FecR domain-containing protein [Ferruginibacter sp.]|nr:FecR domain-containing protein [Ferruginibacter sp.]
MSQSRLSYLFKVYFNKTATPNERDELMELLMHEENDEQLKMLLTNTWQAFNSQQQLFNDKQGDDMFVNILNIEKELKNVSPAIIVKRSFSWVKFAAAAMFIITAGSVYFWLNNIKISPQTVQAKIISTKLTPVIAAGTNKAVLTLADGSNIVLDSMGQGILAKQGNAKVIKLNTTTLAYNATDENNQEVLYNTLATPNGGKYQLILPDGSKVWLNAASSIHFPTIFTGKERRVTVTGEAYFEVAKNAAMPFKITVKDMEVEVLGTHFNVMAYDDENSMNTTLLEGSVKISKGVIKKMLVPGQQSVINSTGEINIVDADMEEVMAWKNGWFQFNAADIKTVMRQISRWYAVEVVYEGKIPDGHYSGAVSRDNDIFQVLKIMQSGGVRFKIEGRKVIVLS